MAVTARLPGALDCFDVWVEASGTVRPEGGATRQRQAP